MNNIKKILNQFEIILLDMGDTFMFNCDRFNQPNEIKKYFINNNFKIDIDKISYYINYLYDEMIKIGRNEIYYENFFKINEFINSDKILKILPENEKDIIEDLFAFLEIGQITEKYKKIIIQLSKTYKLGLISNVWSKSIYFIDYFKNIGIFDCFKKIIFSSDYNIIKPSKKLFNLAFQHFKKEKKDYVYIGNSYKRDVIGSKNSGICSILINNGKQSEINGDILPDYIINDIEEII